MTSYSKLNGRTERNFRRLRDSTKPNHAKSDGDMLLVDGEPVSSPTGSSGRELVAALMGNPGLCAASERLRAAPEKQILSGPEGPRHVYVFQREYATVDPARVELVGTDEMTTCVGVAVRNNKTGMTSVSHMDFPKIVEGGFRQMLELLGDDNAPFDVHLIGGFDDASTKVVHPSGGKHSKQEGYSHPLCCKIVEVLHKFEQQFHLRSFCVLGNNTMTDSYGNARPIVGGFVDARLGRTSILS